MGRALHNIVGTKTCNHKASMLSVSIRFILCIALADALSAFHVPLSSLNQYNDVATSFRSRNSICSARNCRGRLMMATRSNEYPLGVVGDFSLILAQSAILASATSIVFHEIPNISHSAKVMQFQAQEGFENDKLPVLQVQRSYEIRCITDGFEFSQDSDVKVTHGQSVSYRQCEVLRESSSGIL
jgi:hypothetical protein